MWIENGQVRQVGHSLDLHDNLRRPGGRDHSLIPGLINAHMHTIGTTLNDALRFGVTAVLDQFTDPVLVATKQSAHQYVPTSHLTVILTLLLDEMQGALLIP